VTDRLGTKNIHMVKPIKEFPHGFFYYTIFSCIFFYKNFKCPKIITIVC